MPPLLLGTNQNMVLKTRRALGRANVAVGVGGSRNGSRLAREVEGAKVIQP